MPKPAVAIGGNPLAAPVGPAMAHMGVLSAFQRADLGRIVMLFGWVGQACWQVPQPVHPSRTLMRPSSATINARAPTGQASTQIVHSWPLVRRQVDSCQTATPMST